VEKPKKKKTGNKAEIPDTPKLHEMLKLWQVEY